MSERRPQGNVQFRITPTEHQQLIDAAHDARKSLKAFMYDFVRVAITKTPIDTEKPTRPREDEPFYQKLADILADAESADRAQLDGFLRFLLGEIKSRKPPSRKRVG